MTKILFVCHGNICRSPMAEFVMKELVRRAGLENQFLIESAATSREEIGNDMHQGSKNKLRAEGIPFTKRHARQFTSEDYEYYDYIVLMDRNNLRNLRWILPSDVYEKESATPCKVSLLMEWAGVSRDVADPWYTGDFQATWDDVNAGCDAMIEKLTSRRL